MYSTARTQERPPQTQRLPTRRPLSLFKGATPTSLATCLPVSVPNSGRQANSVEAVTVPTPGTERKVLPSRAKSGSGEWPGEGRGRFLR